MPDRADIAIYQGDDWSAQVAVHNSDGTPATITGYTAAAQIRTDVADNMPTVIATIACTVASPNVNLALTHTQTAAIAGGKYLWDLQIISGAGMITTVVAGKAVVTPEVTRP